MQNLNSEGISVQLKHDPEETTREDHGWISIVRSDGTELMRDNDYQHNRNYQKLRDTGGKIVQAVVEALEAEPAGSTSLDRADSAGAAA